MSDNNNVSTKKQDINDDNQQEKLVPELRFPEFTDEWKEYKFKDLFDFKKGKGLSKDKVSSKKGKYPAILYGELYTTYNEFIKNIISFTNYDEGILSKKYDILMPSSTTTKGIDLVTASVVPEDNIRLGGDIIILRPKITLNSKFLSLYIKYFLKSEILKLTQGSTIIHLYGKDLKKLNLKLPKIDEQNDIVNLIENINNKIDLLEKKLVLWDKYIFSLKCNYFDNINVEKIVKFKEIIKKGKAGGTPKSSIQSYYNGEIPFLTINDMTKQGKFIKSTEKTITKEGLNNSSAWIVPKNSLLYSMYASIGLVSINKIDLTTSQAIYSIILKDNVNQEYIFHYLKNYKRFIHKYIETGTQGNLNSKIIKNIKIKLPSLEEQNYYSNLFNIFDYKIQTLNTKIKQYKTFKKYLLQNMFI